MMNKKDGNKTRRKDLKMNFQEENPEEENNTFKLPVLRHFQIAGDIDDYTNEHLIRIEPTVFANRLAS